jgi:hypothetical protein
MEVTLGQGLAIPALDEQDILVVAGFERQVGGVIVVAGEGDELGFRPGLLGLESPAPGALSG